MALAMTRRVCFWVSLAMTSLRYLGFGLGLLVFDFGWFFSHFAGGTNCHFQLKVKDSGGYTFASIFFTPLGELRSAMSRKNSVASTSSWRLATRRRSPPPRTLGASSRASSLPRTAGSGNYR